MEDSQAGFHRLDQSIGDSLEQLNAPGIAIGISDREGMIHLAAYGFANREARLPARGDMLYEIGSISKGFAAIALLQLWEAGGVDLNAPIREYLPWFEIHSLYEPFTLHHLLSHTAGIATGGEFHPSQAVSAWLMREQKTGAPPGTNFHYSNDGYKLVGLVLEKLLGMPIQDILAQRVLGRCGMQASSASIVGSLRERMATGYDARYDDRPLPPGGQLAPAPWLESNSADGSIVSNAEDMCRYIRCLLRGGGGLLGEAGFERLTQPVIAPNDGQHGEQYAYGLTVKGGDGGMVLSHGGGMVGYTAHMIADVGSGLGVIVLTNGPSRPDAVAKYALEYAKAERFGVQKPQNSLLDEIARIRDASAYEGIYQSARRSIQVHARGERLSAQLDGELLRLERLEGDHFSLAHPDFEYFPLTFERRDGVVVSLGHGSDRYIRDGKPEDHHMSISDSWNSYCGHYRAHNPWFSNFRIVMREGDLLMIDQLDFERRLIPMDEHEFRIGDDPHSPERIRFAVFIEGQAMLARTGGGEYCRTFTR